MGIQQDGIDLKAQADQDQGWGQFDPSEAIYIRSEHIGVITAAPAHQNKTQSDKGKPQEHEEVIPALENEFLFWCIL